MTSGVPNSLTGQGFLMRPKWLDEAKGRLFKGRATDASPRPRKEPIEGNLGNQIHTDASLRDPGSDSERPSKGFRERASHLRWWSFGRARQRDAASESKPFSEAAGKASLSSLQTTSRHDPNRVRTRHHEVTPDSPCDRKSPSVSYRSLRPTFRRGPTHITRSHRCQQQAESDRYSDASNLR